MRWRSTLAVKAHHSQVEIVFVSHSEKNKKFKLLNNWRTILDLLKNNLRGGKRKVGRDTGENRVDYDMLIVEAG